MHILPRVSVKLAVCVALSLLCRFAVFAQPAAPAPATPPRRPRWNNAWPAWKPTSATAIRRPPSRPGQRTRTEATIPDGLTTPSVGTSGPGHNAWQMTSAALVLFMTLPGLALFYGGLVRRKNVLSVLAQCFCIAGLVTILWWPAATASCSTVGNPFLGGLGFRIPQGRRLPRPNTDYAYWVSQNVFSMYQLMFAIITPALIVGAIAERMKFSAIFLFMTLWMFVVYFPLAHMVWGIDGFMNGVWNADAEDQGDRLRRRHRGAYDLRLVRA